nr:apomucin [Oryctolagus cuniculus]
MAPPLLVLGTSQAASETTATGITTTTGTTVTASRASGTTEVSIPGTSKEVLVTATAPGVASVASATPTSIGKTAGPGVQTGTSRQALETTTTTAITTRGTTSSGIQETSGPGVRTGASVVSTGITATSGRPQAGTSKEATETSSTPGIPTSGCPPSPPPAPVCRGPLGEEKSPGDVWISNCHKCTCTDASAVDCQPQECPSAPTCQSGEKLVQFQSNDTCCTIGYCEPRTCLFNNTDYKIGASFADPSNPCVSYACSLTGFVAVVQDCPRQSWCAEEDRIYDSNNCCYKCKSSCVTSLVNVTVRYNGCKSKVQMARCVGECKKTVRYNYDIFQLESSCLCCREDDYEFRDIALTCPDGSTISYTYRHVTTCSCLDSCQQATTPAPS